MLGKRQIDPQEYHVSHTYVRTYENDEESKLAQSTHASPPPPAPQLSFAFVHNLLAAAWQASARNAFAQKRHKWCSDVSTINSSEHKYCGKSMLRRVTAVPRNSEHVDEEGSLFASSVSVFARIGLIFGAAKCLEMLPSGEIQSFTALLSRTKHPTEISSKRVCVNFHSRVDTAVAAACFNFQLFSQGWYAALYIGFPAHQPKLWQEPSQAKQLTGEVSTVVTGFHSNSTNKHQPRRKWYIR